MCRWVEQIRRPYGQRQEKASVCCKLFPQQLQPFRIQMFTCLPGLNAFLLFNLITTTCNDCTLKFNGTICSRKQQYMTLYAGCLEQYLLYSK